MIKEVLLPYFGMKRGTGWGVVACNVGTQCQNLNWNSAKTTGVVQLTPNFVDHLVMLIKHDLHQKNHISRTSRPPLGNCLKRPKIDQNGQILHSYNTARFVLYGKIRVKYDTTYYTNMPYDTSLYKVKVLARVTQAWSCTILLAQKTCD
jgi:hypothetical protein